MGGLNWWASVTYSSRGNGPTSLCFGDKSVTDRTRWSEFTHECLTRFSNFLCLSLVVKTCSCVYQWWWRWWWRWCMTTLTKLITEILMIDLYSLYFSWFSCKCHGRADGKMDRHGGLYWDAYAETHLKIQIIYIGRNRNIRGQAQLKTSDATSSSNGKEWMK